VPGREVHFEPFLHLADLSAEEALIAWGGFWFRRASSDEGWHIVDDEELTEVTGEPRTESIGAQSEPFGHAVVEVERDGEVVARVESADHNFVRVTDLQPDTEYRYRVLVDGEPATASGATGTSTGPLSSAREGATTTASGPSPLKTRACR
jgi:hypothetical protein